MFSVYILYSEKLDKFYIGYSANVESRLSYHNSLKNLNWTKRGQPWQLFFTIDELSEKQATRIEKHLKRMKSKKYINNLCTYPEITEKLKLRFI